MRVVVASDTHYYITKPDTLKQFVAEIAALRPDCLVVAGDVGEGTSGFEQMLILLETLPCPRLILPGNHDLWDDGGASSDLLWETVLPDLTRRHGANWLEGENWIKDGLGVCGTIGWYDYSAREPSFALTDEQYATMKRAFIVDGDRITWKWTDVEFANLVGAAFEQRLAALQADPSVREILVATHVPVFEEGITRKPDNWGWSVTNAYFCNLTLGQRIVKYPKVRRVVSGHTHSGKTAQVGSIDMRVIPADYEEPVYLVFDYQ